MAKAIGIDIGFHAVKVAVVDGGPKGARLLRFAEAEYEGGGAPTRETMAAALKRALAEAKGPRQAASYALPAESCILREISVPFDTDDQIQKVVKFEFEPHLHQGAIEDVVLDYVRTGSARAGSRLLCIAAQKALVKERLELLGAAGVDPIHVDVDVASIFNLAKQSGCLDEHPNCLVIDIGARTTQALAIRDGQLRVARSIRLGAKGAEARLESQFQGDREAAKRALDSAAGVEALAAPVSTDGPSTVEIVSSVREVEAAVARAVQDDFLSRVLRETQRSMPSVGDDKPLTRVFLTGGGATHARARERIAQHFGVEVADLPVLAKLEHRLSPGEAQKVSVSGAVAVGTALKVIGVDAGEIDLRQEEFRFSRTFDRVKTSLAIAATLLFVGVFVVALTEGIRLKKARREAAAMRAAWEKELDEQVFAEYRKSVPEPRKRPPDSPDAAVWFRDTRKYMKDIRNHMKNELGLATEVPPIRSCLEPWSAVSQALAEVRPKVEFLLVKDEKYQQERADVTVIVGDLADSTPIALALRKRTDLFAEQNGVEIGEPKPTKDGRQEIVFKLRLRPKENPQARPAGPAKEGN